MMQFVLKREAMGASITVQVVTLLMGYQISVYGGTLPHIGAVSIVDPQGNISTQQFPAHKDSVISEEWAKVLHQRGYFPAVVVAGIHYDSLSRRGIEEVLKQTEELLAETLDALAHGKNT